MGTVTTLSDATILNMEMVVNLKSAGRGYSLLDYNIISWAEPEGVA